MTMSKTPFKDSPPLTDRVNAYDEAHLATYLRLLDAAEEGADWREVVKIVFGLHVDVDADPERAKRMHDTHLARARWMTEQGYPRLLEPRMQ
jgi:predicted SprT family Zn-dependent metalloprotease